MEGEGDVLVKLMQSRRVCRAFSSTPLPAGWLTAAIDTAERAPTAGNTKPTRLRSIEGKDNCDAFWTAAWPTRERDDDDSRFYAPSIVVVVSDRLAYNERYAQPDKQIVDESGSAVSAIDRWPTDFAVVDASFAAYGLLLLAEDAGIGGWFFGVDGPSVGALLRLHEGASVIGAIALGYASDQGNLGLTSS